MSVFETEGFLSPIGAISGLYWGCMGIMEQKMETTLVYSGYIGIILASSPSFARFWYRCCVAFLRLDYLGLKILNLKP